MAGQRRRSKPKYSIVTLIILLLLAVFYNYYIKGTKPPVDEHPTEAPTKKVRKAKTPKRTKVLRNLTVFTGTVVGIKDGDTFEILYDGQPERVRLADIDCPEKSQPFGKNAKQFSSDLCFNKTVTVTCNAKRDRYGRLIGTVVTEDGINVNEALVKEGFAWHYLAYSNKEELTGYEAIARKKHLGLWADANPTPPWDWRREKRNRNAR